MTEPDRLAEIRAEDEAITALYILVRNFAHGAIFQRVFEESAREVLRKVSAAEREAREIADEVLAETREEFRRHMEDWNAMREERDRLARLVEGLTNAIRWALGEIDDFPPRNPGQGAYWWRTELRRRTALAAAASEEG